MTDTRDPVLRISASHRDINSNGHIFGGWVLSQMDIAGGIIAGEVCAGPCATVAIEGMAFLQPSLVRDIVSVYGEVIRRGRTSVAIKLDVIAMRGPSKEEVKVTEGIFTFVALDENHRPKPLPPV